VADAVSIHFATEPELARWDELVREQVDGGDVWRGRDYAEQKRAGHYTPHYVVVNGRSLDTDAESWNLYLTVHEKSVPFLGKIWYLPKGPAAQSLAEVTWITRVVADFARAHGAFLVKVEPRMTWLEAAESLPDFVTPETTIEQPHAALLAARVAVRSSLIEDGFHPGMSILPNASTVLLPLAGEEDALLKGLGQKARYAINRARRDGVTVERVPATDENCERMYQLLAHTADGSFGIRPKSYYRSYWKRFAAAGTGQMFFAHYEGQLVAAAFAMVYGDRSTYKDGASLRQKTGYGASHLMQWEVIRWAREQGSVLHDLCGAPPADEQDDKHNQFYGIGLFKTSFIDEITDYIRVWDYPLSTAKYRLWSTLIEKLALRFSLWFRHDPFY
jgi:lipid II:glycine glycyltransferase (peptidoglycan interpeptide bridge formation enzyme)